MRPETGALPDWRDGAAYAPLLGADRSLFAWEWLRRDSTYRSAAAAASANGQPVHLSSAPALFGLVAFEPPVRPVPDARPLWRGDCHLGVLPVRRSEWARTDDLLPIDRLSALTTLVGTGSADHLLLSDGFRMIRLDAPAGTFASRPLGLSYELHGLASAEPLMLTLRRLLALGRTGRFACSLHPPESRARRWILTLRTFDALAAGAEQRQIAETLLSKSAAATGWRSREPSLRSQSQRLVRSARLLASGGYRLLLSPESSRRQIQVPLEQSHP